MQWQLEILGIPLLGSSLEPEVAGAIKSRADPILPHRLLLDRWRAVMRGDSPGKSLCLASQARSIWLACGGATAVDNVVQIIAGRHLNNGQPSAHAKWIASASIKPTVDIPPDFHGYSLVS
jgi:hypothetical protein